MHNYLPDNNEIELSAVLSTDKNAQGMWVM